MPNRRARVIFSPESSVGVLRAKPVPRIWIEIRPGALTLRKSRPKGSKVHVRPCDPSDVMLAPRPHSRVERLIVLPGDCGTRMDEWLASRPHGRKVVLWTPRRESDSWRTTQPAPTS